MDKAKIQNVLANIKERAISNGLKDTFRYYLSGTWDLLKLSVQNENYYEDLRKDLLDYKFQNKSQMRGMFHVFLWNIKAFIKYSWKSKASDHVNTSKPTELLNDGIIKMMIEVDGGIGDKVISMDYIQHLRLKYNSDRLVIHLLSNGFNFIDYFVENGKAVEKSFSKNLYESVDEYAGGYDIVLRLYRYPILHKCNYSKVHRVYPEFYDYLSRCEDFIHRNKRLQDYGDICFGQYAQYEMIRGRHRYQQPDFNSELGMDATYTYPIPLQDNVEFLESVGLRNKTFITLHSGVDTSLQSKNVKLWPVDKYNKLIKIIKMKHPEIVIVQIGASDKREQSMEGTDLNLVGQTDMECTKLLLKHACLHIDCEGGLVHIRHALKGGPSAVIFGPTPVNFYGYPENINISGTGCGYWCEFTARRWHTQCIQTPTGIPKCMKSITAEQVYARISGTLGGGSDE